MSEFRGDLSIGQALDFGTEFAMAGRHQDAEGLFRGVLVHEPQNFEAINRLGTSLFEQGQIHEALYWFWRGRKINRRHPLALTNYGLCLSRVGHPEEGVIDLERAVHFAAKAPTMSPEAKSLCYNNLGNTLLLLQRFRAALEAFDTGIAINPRDAFPHFNRGITLLKLNRHREGIAALTRALDLGASSDTASRLNTADVFYNRGLARLLLGEFKEGFADYEYRLLTSENKQPNLGLDADRKWTGGPIAGQTIFVTAEQGIGDAIQSLRFLPALVETGADVLLHVHPAVRGMVEIPGVRLLPPGEPPIFNYWVALMSLPLYLGTTEATIPKPWRPRIDDGLVEEWAHQLFGPPPRPTCEQSGLNVGVCWAGNFQHKNDAHRSIPLDQFADLFDEPSCTFVSLQQMRAEDRARFADLKTRHKNLSALWFEDMRDTAAAILNLDVIVSADTSVAHMAATLGVPTFIMVPAFATDWRWQTEREDSPWYPSARLFRQPTVGDWASVIARIRSELRTAAPVLKAA